MPNFDALRELQDETRDKHIEAEREYIKREMIDPLIGYTVVNGKVDAEDLDGMPLFANPFPVLTFRHPVTNHTITMLVSSDDECNEGGRLIPIA